MSLPRPQSAPKKIPMWAWQLESWLNRGKQGPRPKDAPARVPAWFWWWRRWTLARARGAGSKQWKNYLAAVKQQPKPAPAPTGRERIVAWARWGAEHEPAIHYTMGEHRDDWLTVTPGTVPIATDCSGKVTLNYDWSDLPDPNGLAYRVLGWTGTILSNAYEHGQVFEDVSRALPGDPIVIGPGDGDHVVTCVEAGQDPLVESHGWEGGPVIQRLSVDHRVPRRVCRTLAA